jgi:hypothetical protein
MLKKTLFVIAAFSIAHSTLATPLTIESLGNGVYVHHGVHEDMSEGYHADICNVSLGVVHYFFEKLDLTALYKE